jgi:hypothetical protein
MDSFAVCATFRPQVLHRPCDFVPDYWAELPEDNAPEGRVLLPKNARETMSDGRVVIVHAASPCSSSCGLIGPGRFVPRQYMRGDR